MNCNSALVIVSSLMALVVLHRVIAKRWHNDVAESLINNDTTISTSVIKSVTFTLFSSHNEMMLIAVFSLVTTCIMFGLLLFVVFRIKGQSEESLQVEEQVDIVSDVVDECEFKWWRIVIPTIMMVIVVIVIGSCASRSSPVTPTQSTAPSFTVTNEEGKSECPICFEELANPTTLPCGHQYHQQCIDEWLSDHNTCPYCRQPAY